MRSNAKATIPVDFVYNKNPPFTENGGFFIVRKARFVFQMSINQGVLSKGA